MKIEKIKFKNRNGHELVGRLAMPADSHPHNYVLFAHCFTCTKNLMAIRNISNAMVSKGYAVLRFDFTGLGESEGEFEETNFTGNVEDLIDAARFMAKSYNAPSLLVGHSLGGAATLFAALHIESVKAVATIASPSEPSHVIRLLEDKLDKIIETGKANVTLGGTSFTVKRQFLEDLKNNKLPEVMGKLNKPLLLLHSPQDDTVGIVNAEILYKSAKHPKSFISLDGADHLLSKKEDSHFAGEVIASWASRYVPMPEPQDSPDSTHQVVAVLAKDEGYTTLLKAGRHYLLADEPVSFGGNDFGPTPYDLVSAGLAACTAMTLQMYAKRKNWPLEEVHVHTSYSKSHAEDCEHCDSDEARLDTFHREVDIMGPLDEKQRARLFDIANKCPVHRTLHSEIQVITKPGT